MPDQTQLQAHQRTIIQKYFQQPDPTRLNLPQLQKWHAEYTAAPQSITSDHPVLQQVQSDTVDPIALENCITDLATHISVTNTFCTDCHAFFTTYPDLSDPDALDPRTKRHWPGSGADWAHVVARTCHTLVLEAAARQGCRFCAFVMQMLRDAGLWDVYRRVEVRLCGVGDEEMSTSLSVQNWGRNTSQLLWMNLPGKLVRHCNNGMACETKFESAALDSDADVYDEKRDVLDIAKTWMEDCARDHKDCNKNKDNVLPTRLISIAGDVPRLVLTKGWETSPRHRYSTLSHRWGEDNFLKLTEENHESFLTSVPLSELPKTFVDAIHISQRLGLEYIWIDSLCIIQGDAADWSKEAGSMSSVYGNSYLNIAASSAVNVHEGCFLKPPSMVDGLRVPITINGVPLVREFRSSSVYALSTTESHLSTRAWALQERVLPSRTIHFGRRGAFWECRTTTANEFLPGGFPNKLGRGLLNERIRTEHFASWWSDVVRLYSKANLTYPSDKLPALCGIARRAYEERGGRYLAGLWQDEDIEAQLCWRVTTPRARPAWRAPSWSWASVDGEVGYRVRQEGILDTVYAHVLDAETKLLGANPFGEVSGGSLRIACSGMLDARYGDAGTVKIHSGDAELEYSVFLDCLDEETKIGSTVYLMPLLGGRTGSAMSRGGDDGEKERVEEMMVCGLLLKMRDGSAGHFSRIGTFQFYKDPMMQVKRKVEERFDPFMKAFELESSKVTERVCVEVIENSANSNEQYVISIF